MEGAPCPQSRNGSPYRLCRPLRPIRRRHQDGARPRAIAAIALPRGQSGRQCCRRNRSPVPHRRTPGRQLAGQQAQIQDLQERLEHAIEITRDKQDEFASVAQAEGVSLSVVRRLLQVLAGSGNYPERADVGTGHRGSWPTVPASCSKCSTRWPNPRSNRPPPTKFFWAQTGLDARRTRQPVLGRGTNGRSPRWPDVGCGIRPVFSVECRRPGRWQRPGQVVRSWSVPDVAPKDSRISRIRWTSFTRSARVAVPCGKARRGQPRPGASRGGPEGVGTAGPCRENRGLGHATRTSRLWRQAEGLWDQAMAAERAWKLTRSAFEFFTPEGRFNDRQQGQAVVVGVLPHLSGPAWAKTRRSLALAERASRSWTKCNGVWLSWDWTPTSCRPCWTWKACMPSLATVGVNARLSRDTGLGVGPHGPTGEGSTPLAGFSWAGS